MKEQLQHIILTDKSIFEQLEGFEKEFFQLTIGEKIYQCQSLNDQYDELNLAKLFLVYLVEEQAIKFEIKRILSWSHKKEKANFFINQLSSPDTDVLIIAIELLGILGDPLAIPFLNEIFSINDIPICKAIIQAFGRINDPFSAKTIRKALKSKDPTLVLKAVEVLSQWIYQVPWKTFIKLLYNNNKNIKLEAAHAISLRRPKKAARHFLKIIKKEKDTDTRYELIKISGLIPNPKLMKTLLKIITQDKDQKARLIASRSLDRLQSVLKHDDLFKLRKTSDKHIKAEIIFRLGKFGSDDDAHKKYLRKMLLKSKDQTIIQASLQALGHIADHQDLEVITQFIFKDPSSSYNALVALSKTWRQEDNDTVYLLLKEGLSSAYAAALALTKMWRIDDKSKILKTVSHEAFSPTQKQIILKYLIRRRGLGLDPGELLDTIMRILDKETNINVRYLALQVLEFAPSQETLYFLISCYKQSHTTSELEVVQNNFSLFCQHHPDILFNFMKNCDFSKTEDIIRYIPVTLELPFYQTLSLTLFEKYTDMVHTENNKLLFDSVYRIFFTKIEVAQQFTTSLESQSLEWQRAVLTLILKKSSLTRVKQLQKQLIALLRVDDDQVRSLVIELLMPIKDMSIVHDLVMIAEENQGLRSGEIAKRLAKSFVEEGIL